MATVAIRISDRFAVRVARRAPTHGCRNLVTPAVPGQTSSTSVPNAPRLSISPLELTRLPPLRFPGRVVVVNSAEDEKRIESLFDQQELLGFDSESRPSSALAPKNKSALVQVASEKIACLWRVSEIGSLPPLLKRLIEDPAIQKVSQGALHEVNALRDEFGVSPQSFIDLHHIALHLRTTPRSLQGLAGLFLHKRLNKDQRLSDWEQSPLTQAQIEYAAIDAWASRQVLVEMRKAFLCNRLECERLLGAAAASRSPLSAGIASSHFSGALANPAATAAASSATTAAPSWAESSLKQPTPRREVPTSGVAPPPPAEAHQELAALCVKNGYVLRFDGFESMPSGFRCVFRVEFRQNGQSISEAFRSKRIHAAIRAAQNDAASQALERLKSLSED
eukprot:TRINITY_DN53097_c0_g1_i1.p1 TRINITY_DN53097_c0_g1~~TRINITY_DN53097_c0_g1_i1.p1  ORF type:complete len:393 (+),score=69.89 TRINITY_DN53097_c0_g1_i1:60-1238(+)